MKIRASLYNKTHLEYGVVTIPFPIPPDQYDSTIGMLESLDIGNPLARDCAVEEIQGPCPILKRLEGTRVNVDELDYLIKRLDSFTDNELAQFQGMAAAKGFAEITDLINLTFCCQQATVITDFSDLEQIGRDHYLNLHGGCASMEELERLDARRTALDLILNDTSGKITPFGVVYDNGMRLRQLYTGRQFPAYKYGDSILDAFFTSTRDAPRIMFLSLPMPKLQLERMIRRGGFEGEELTVSKVLISSLSESLTASLDLTRENVWAINAMCAACLALSRRERDKLAAASAIASPKDSAQLRRLAENLDLFDFVPDVHTPEEYGRHLIRQSGRFDYDSELDAFYDYKKYGQQRVSRENGVFMEQGYVSYHGTLPLEELMGQSPAGQSQEDREEGMEMGGLS